MQRLLEYTLAIAILAIGALPIAIIMMLYRTIFSGQQDYIGIAIFVGVCGLCFIIELLVVLISFSIIKK